MELEKMQGVIRTLRKERNSGIILGEDDTNYFFHKHGFRGNWENLREGDRVTFEVLPSKKGPKAVSVILVRIGGERI